MSQIAGRAGRIGLWNYNVTRDLVMANARMAGLFGVDHEAARGGRPQSDFLITIHASDVDRIVQRVSAAARNCGEYSETYQVLDASGTPRTLLAQGACYLNDKNEICFPGTLIEVSPEDLAGLSRGVEDLPELAHVLATARAIAEQQQQGPLRHLMNMTLRQIAPRLAHAVQMRRRTWN